MTKFENREGIQAVNAENRTVEALRGNYVDNGLEVTTDGTDMVLDVSSGTVVQQNEEHGIDATSVTVPDNTEDEPRKDIIYVDDTQSVSIATGAAESPDPALEDVDSVFYTARPSPPSLVNQDDVVILAEVWVEPEEDDLVEDDLQDRRVKVDIAGSGVGNDFSHNQVMTDLEDADYVYLHAPIDFEGAVEIEVNTVNLGDEEGEVPEGASIQLFDIDGADEDLEDQDNYVLEEWTTNFEKDNPIISVEVSDKTVVFRMVNDTGENQRIACFISGVINE